MTRQIQDYAEKKPGGKLIVFDSLIIQSPKRNGQAQRGWDEFFPYYAGYPENFARDLLKSAHLDTDAVVWDPWNGSGTTTFSASQLGLASCGFDLNPVMVIIAHARLLAPSEADSLEPLARELIRSVQADQKALLDDDPLLWWYARPAAALIRALERRIREHLVGDRTKTPTGTRLEHISGLAATFYVAVFSICRQLAAPFQSSNPTWLRRPKPDEVLIETDREAITGALTASIRNMAAALADREQALLLNHASTDLRLADTTKTALGSASVDMVLTSPPYCTRIDYSAATRVELAVLHPLIGLEMEDLGRLMIGSTRVPDHEIAVQESWGAACSRFISAVKSHPSKASGGYYYKTHLDYFDKMSRSLANVSTSLKPNGAAILVVQDSYYKDVHNDLPAIIAEMAAAKGLKLRRRDDFHFTRSMARINPHARTYKRAAGAIESVLCFERIESPVAW